jgi:hypothetical protein
LVYLGFEGFTNCRLDLENAPSELLKR